MKGDAITVDHVSKHFRVPLDHGATLQYRFSHPISSSRYRDLIALDDISFTVSPGEFIGIAGPNGCGKSTLLKLLARIYKPDAGNVALGGRVSPFLELGVGFKPELTARENVFLGGSVLGLTRGMIGSRLDDVFRFSELEEFADQKLKNFSSGMAVRLAFSVAMLADADILLMDEVLAVGDARFQEKCFEVFAEYKRENRTIVLVSHDLTAMDLYCDRVLLLQDGRLVADGAARDVTAIYRRIVGSMSDGPGTLTADLRDLPSSQRWGSREIEVTDVRTLDDSGNRHHAFRTGQKMVVAVDYRCNQAIDEFVCGLAFKRSDGINLAGPNTKMASYRLPPARAGSEGTVLYEIPNVTLLGASYLLSASLYDRHLSHPYDYLDDVLEFRVSDDIGRFGMVELGGEWRHNGHAGRAAGMQTSTLDNSVEADRP